MTTEDTCFSCSRTTRGAAGLRTHLIKVLRESLHLHPRILQTHGILVLSDIKLTRRAYGVYIFYFDRAHPRGWPPSCTSDVTRPQACSAGHFTARSRRRGPRGASRVKARLRPLLGAGPSLRAPVRSPRSVMITVTTEELNTSPEAGPASGLCSSAVRCPMV